MSRTVQLSGGLDEYGIRQHAETMQFSSFDAFRFSIGEGMKSSFGAGTLSRHFSLPTDGQSMTEEDYRSSMYYREAIPWDEGMTDERAAALAADYDFRTVRRRILDQTDTFAVQTIGDLFGQATDPINYVPVAGPLARAAGVAKATGIAGRAAYYSADAAGNTLAAGLLTQDLRRQLGDNATLQTLMAEVAGAALIGGVFGSVQGAYFRAKSQRSAVALRNAADAHQALDEAVASLVETGEVSVRQAHGRVVNRLADEFNPALHDDLLQPVDRADLFRTTTLGRVVDTRGPDIGDFETFLRDQVLAKNPELNTRYVAARDAFEEAQAAVEAIEGPLAARTDADVAAMLDPESGERIRSIDAELLEPIPSQRRQALEQERNGVLESLGVDRLVKAENDFRIGPKKRSKQAQKKVTSARRALAAVQREVDSVVSNNLSLNRTLHQPKLDLTAPREDPLPAAIAEAETRTGRPVKDVKELADEFGLDENGNFDELEDLKLMEQQERMTDAEKNRMAKADEIMSRTEAYNRALLQAAVCEVG